jgi:hypothetical protein
MIKLPRNGITNHFLQEFYVGKNVLKSAGGRHTF